GGRNVGRIARWDGVAWHPLGTGVVGTVGAMARMPNGDIIVGGASSAGGVTVSGLARWDGAAWSSMENSGVFTDATALLVLPTGELVAGGLIGTSSSRIS